MMARMAFIMVAAGIWLIDHAERLAPMPPMPESIGEPMVVRCPRCGAGGPALAWLARPEPGARWVDD